MSSIEARGLRKAYGTTIALDGVDLRVEEGRIVGLIGPNGAGKTTALNAILGLTPYDGELTVLGRDPWNERDQLMRDVCFIADVAVLPRWMRVSAGDRLSSPACIRASIARRREALPREDQDRTRDARARALQGHGDPAAPRAGHGDRRAAAGARRADARPRHPLSQAVLRHAAERLFRRHPHHRRDHPPGRGDPAHPHRPDVHRPRPHRAVAAAWRISRRAIAEVMVHPEHVGRRACAEALHERQVFGRSILLFDGVDRDQLAALGEVRTPSIADLFVAVIGSSRADRRESPHEYADRARSELAAPTRQPPLPATRPLYWSRAARIVGEPLDLRRAAGRRRRRGVRLPASAWSTCRHWRALAALEPALLGSLLATRYGIVALRSFHRVDRRGVLLPRRAARRTPRPQHPVLEVAAGVGSHDGALQGEHPAGQSCRSIAFVIVVACQLVIAAC